MSRDDLTELFGWGTYVCTPCIDNWLQPERSKREDANKWFGMKAEFKQDGLCYLEDGRVIDPNQVISDAVL